MSDKGKKKLRILPGVGPPIEFDAEQAAHYHGSITDGVTGLLRNEAADPELADLMGEPGTVLFERSSDGSGRTRERPLPSNESWDQVVARLQDSQTSLDIEMARAHKGG